MPEITFTLDTNPTFRSLGRDFFEYQGLQANQWFYACNTCFARPIKGVFTKCLSIVVLILLLREQKNM